jgi:hypothetical protein
MFVDLESTHQGLSFEVLHYMVLSISKFRGVSNFRPAARPIKVKADQPQKINQLSGRPYATFTQY